MLERLGHIGRHSDYGVIRLRFDRHLPSVSSTSILCRCSTTLSDHVVQLTDRSVIGR